MKIDDIINWCVANNQVAWLKAKAAEKPVDKNGKAHDITFIELKLAFVREFMSDIAPKAKEKAPTMYERIAAL